MSCNHSLDCKKFHSEAHQRSADLLIQCARVQEATRHAQARWDPRNPREDVQRHQETDYDEF